MPPELAPAPHTCGVVLWHVRRGGTCLRCVAPLTDGAAAGTWRGETTASGLHGVDLAVGLVWMLLLGVLWADLTRSGGEVHWSKPIRAKSKG